MELSEVQLDLCRDSADGGSGCLHSLHGET
jgi:hypothetical protein